MLAPIGTLLFLLAMAMPASCDNTVADDVGVRVMGRISELLSPKECQAFYLQITGPDHQVEEGSARLLESQYPIYTRGQQDITSVKECKESLTRWLQAGGDTMYWDRLSRVLQQIGSSDVSKLLRKNCHQDKDPEIKKDVEEYHRTVRHLTSSLLRDEDEEKSEKLLPSYNRILMGWSIPLMIGVVVGFLVSFFFYSYEVCHDTEEDDEEEYEEEYDDSTDERDLF